MDWNRLTLDVANAAKKSFARLISTHDNESFYAFSLYTDSSAMTVLAAANSLQKLEQKVSSSSPLTPQDEAYYKWATSEWGYEAIDAQQFKEISTALRGSQDRKDFSCFKEKLIDCLTKALHCFKESPEFKKNSPVNKVFFFVSVTDDDNFECIENETAKILNNEELYNEFLARYDV